MFKTIAVIGSGTMGNGIAHVFAQSSFQVKLFDTDNQKLDKAVATIANNLDRMLKKEKISLEEKKATLHNIETFTSLSPHVSSCDLVVEAIPENFLLKAKVFEELDKLCGSNTILASNTSSISITKLAAQTQRADKVIGMHFMNPVPVMQLVEVIKGYSTSADTTQAILSLSNKLNKIPVEVNDYPGFVANRILMPMINEAIETLYHSVAGVNEIDTVMKLGMAHPMGPLALADFIGLDVCLSIMNVLYKGLNKPKYAPCPLLVNMVAAGKLGVKSGEGFYNYSQSRKAEKVARQFLP